MNLEQQKKRSRDLLRAVRSGDAGAATRLRQNHLRWASVDDATLRQELALHDAQFAIAREEGFASWTKLKAHTEAALEDGHSRIFVPDMKWMRDRVHGLLRCRKDQVPAALEQIREWHPRFAGLSDQEILQAPFDEADAGLVYAREHGFDSWQELALRVNRLAADRNAGAAEPFLGAFEALRSGDIEALRALLRRDSRLAKARGSNGNTLLNLAVSLTRLEMVECLVDAGAEVNEGNARGWTALHQAAYLNHCGIAELLIRGGADLEVEAHGSGGTPLVVALFWGHREVAEVIGRDSLAPWNLRVAAGMGEVELLEEVLSRRDLTARGFYRPHSGFPDWRPRPEWQEVLNEGLVWAAKSGRVSVLGRLVEAGAQLDADVYRGTPLIWAAVCNRMEAAGWLLDHGAEVNLKATFGGLTHGQGVTALIMAAQYGHLEMVKFLIGRGADPKIKDDLYGGDAAGAARHFGQVAVADYLMSARNR